MDTRTGVYHVEKCARCGAIYALHEMRDDPSWSAAQWREQDPACPAGGGLWEREPAAVRVKPY